MRMRRVGGPMATSAGSGVHARRRSAGIVAGRGFPRHSLQRPLGGLSDVPFRADAVMLGSSEEEHPGDSLAPGFRANGTVGTVTKGVMVTITITVTVGPKIRKATGCPVAFNCFVLNVVRRGGLEPPRDCSR